MAHFAAAAGMHASPNLTTQSSPVLVVCLQILGGAPALVLISE
jgi:hypothetical protein